MSPSLEVSLDDCILWTGSIGSNGYGKRQVHGRTVGAHRAAWEEERGPIPDGLFVLHRCDNPPCCNVEHLFLGTHTDNMRDMARKGRGVVRRGVDHHSCVVTPEQVVEARKLYHGGCQQKVIAQWLGIGQSAVSNLVRGVTHGAVADPNSRMGTCGGCQAPIQTLPGNRKYCNSRCRVKFRRRVLSERELIDGRLIATAAENHGSLSTYSNYGCRCIPCANAQSAYKREWAATRAGRPQ